MKKLLAVVLASVMVFSLIACGSASSESKSESTVKTVQSGKLVMVTNAAFPPYEYISDDGSEKIIGIDIEIAQLIADSLGLELVVEDMEFTSLLTAVQSGKADIVLAGLTVTDERKQNVDFSSSYAKGVQSIIVKEGSAIKTVDDIKSDGSMKIGVQDGTTGCIYAGDTVENGGYGEDNVIAYSTGALAVEALIAGKVDCVIIDNNPAKEFVKANQGLTILETSFVEEDYAAAIAKGNTALLEAINKVFAEKTADGTIQAILDKYIKAE